MKVLLVITSLIITIFTSPIDQKANEAQYRLPEGAINVNSYEVLMVLDTDIFTTHKYLGTTVIDFNILQTSKEIKLHANGIVFQEVHLTLNNVDIELTNNSYESDNITDILTLETSQDLVIGTNYILTLIYEADLRTNEMYGFYKSSYVKSDGTVQALASTQFQPTHARKAFPCFDEPLYKATFDIKIKHPKQFSASSNTFGTTTEDPEDINLAITIFKKTPKMSTYLVAFVVSDFTCTNSSTSIDVDVPHSVCSRQDTENDRSVALEAGPKLVKVMEEFTGVKYGASGIGKMEEFAIPDFSSGAMENWGLITYRETGILWNEHLSSNLYKQRLEAVVSHEITHMWFGNLITTHWWSDTFLNEGFARFFQYFATGQIEPDWEMNKQFAIEQVQSALIADAKPSSTALSSDVFSPAECSAKFNTISYNKGASVIRMTQHLMGADNFKKGIQQYLSEDQFGTTTPNKLVTALQKNTVGGLPADTDLSKVLKNWIEEPGFPLLSVSLEGKNIRISQKRFLVSNTEAKQIQWYVPITYTLSNSTNKFEDLSTKAWLSPDKDLIIENVLEDKDESWIILNNQQIGFYRVKYDQVLLDRIKNILNQANNGIHDNNKAQLIDDIYNIANIGETNYSNVLDFISFLKIENSYYTWYSAFKAFDSMIQKISNKQVDESLKRYILQLMDHLLISVPFETIDYNNQIFTLNKVQALTWACNLGHTDCLKKSAEAFEIYKSNSTIPDKNLNVVIYCNGLRQSSNLQNDWQFLWNKFKTTSLATEEISILTALGCAPDKSVLTEYLEKSIDPASGIRQQDALTVFSSVYTQNPDGVNIAFDFLLQNHRNISEYYGSLNSLNSLISGLADRFTTQAQIDKLKTFLDSTDLPESLILAGQSALKNAEANLKWTKEVESQLTNYFKKTDNENSSSVRISNGLISLCALAFIFWFY